MSISPQGPELRPLDVRPFVQYGQPHLYLRDPLQLSDRVVVLPRYLGALLLLCDGTRAADSLRAELLTRFGLPVSADTVASVLSVLDEAFLLNNDHFRAAQARRLQDYRAAPFRPPALAGQSYPAAAGDLFRLLNDYLEGASEVEPASPPGRGLLSPHIDYARGGPVYAQVWKRAAETARTADLAILFGTDHFSDRLINLTRQHYATPYGVLPTDQAIVDELADALGPDAAFGGELRHRTEHSLELVLVWLHHLRAGKPITVIPILTGSFAHFVQGDQRPQDDPTLQAVLDTLRRATAGRRTLVVASGDLAHIGPAFGGEPVDADGRSALQAADAELMRLMGQGDAEGFFGAIRRVRDRNNVCGVSPVYLTLRYLESAQGEAFGYDHCPADEAGASLVSVCGMTFA